MVVISCGYLHVVCQPAALAAEDPGACRWESIASQVTSKSETGPGDLLPLVASSRPKGDRNCEAISPWQHPEKETGSGSHSKSVALATGHLSLWL